VSRVSIDTQKARVLLVKVSGALGQAPVGEQYQALFRSDVPRNEQVHRAYRMLKRERPSENPMCWEVSA
jgi:hypothetical protein